MAQGSQLFSDKLDRVTFSAYFLGAVVPLIALAVVVERFVLPTLDDRNASISLVVLVISAALLTLGSFLVLRHQTRKSLDRMDHDNHRLESLLEVSSRLASVQHVTEATDCATEQALGLANAAAVYLFVRSGEGSDPSLAASAGAEASKLYEVIGEKLNQIPPLVFESERPLLRGSGEGSGEFVALAVPLPGDPVAIGALIAVRPAPATEFSPEETDALSTLAALAAVALNNGDLRDSQRNFFAHVTDIIVSGLDSHLELHQGHSHRVAQLSNRLGRALELDDSSMQRLHFASLLHDLGMLKLNRAQQMNRKTCDKHTIIGSRMLGRIRLWKDLAPIIRHHHEWWDGTGYPDGIAESEIPFESRIISVCDAFESMTSASGYGEARSMEDALAELEQCKGSQFDPKIVAAFHGLAAAGHLDI